MSKKILEQIKGKHDVIMAVLVNKVGLSMPGGGKHITLTEEDFKNFPQDQTLLVRGHPNAIQLYVLTHAQAKEIEKDVLAHGGIGLHE